MRPFTYYIVETGGGRMLASLTLNDTVALNANVILSDMGKTTVINGYIYRKVQIATASDDTVSYGNRVGYICLNSDLAPLFGSNRQGISKLN
jgi:hypothetical protein